MTTGLRDQDLLRVNWIFNDNRLIRNLSQTVADILYVSIMTRHIVSLLMFTGTCD
jgi:hypothetical protein